MRNFRDLRVYIAALDFAVEVYKFKENLPKTEEFGLKDQFRRASTSISINISEGCSKSTDKHFKTYLEHALGSTYEIETILVLCKRIYNLENNKILEDNLAIQRMIVALIKTLK